MFYGLAEIKNVICFMLYIGVHKKYCSNIAANRKQRPPWLTCVVVKAELDAVRFTFKLIVRGVAELVRIQQLHALSSTHHVHMWVRSSRVQHAGDAGDITPSTLWNGDIVWSVEVPLKSLCI